MPTAFQPPIMVMEWIKLSEFNWHGHFLNMRIEIGRIFPHEQVWHGICLKGSAAPLHGGAGDPNNQHERKWKMANFYCKHCGARFSSVNSLTAGSCPRHPAGCNKGRHELYEGSEKDRYTCKYCGSNFSSISVMTGSSCPRHPNGCNKGKHSPSL